MEASFDSMMNNFSKLVSNENTAKTLMMWAGFITATLFVWYFLSSGDFSFLLTLAAFMRCFGFGLLNFKMWGEKSARGVSVKTLELYALTFFFRLISIMRHQGYLPFDKSGDWFYHSVELLSLVAVLACIYGIFGPLMSTYDQKHDKFGDLYIAPEYGIAYIVAPCLVLALLFHPALNKEFFSDTCWTISMYLEAVAMLPQIYMFQRQATADGTSVEPLVGHTIFAVGFSRIFEFFFWLGSFKELSDHSGGRIPGYVVLFSQIVHLVLMGDTFYYYMKSVSAGVPMQLPTNSNYQHFSLDV